MIYQFPVATDNSCGIGAIELESRRFQQPDLFMPDNSNPALMKCFDKINNRYSEGTLKLGAEGKSEFWQMRR
jgi:DNA polymerase V